MNIQKSNLFYGVKSRVPGFQPIALWKRPSTVLAFFHPRCAVPRWSWDHQPRDVWIVTRHLKLGYHLVTSTWLWYPGGVGTARGTKTVANKGVSSGTSEKRKTKPLRGWWLYYCYFYYYYCYCYCYYSLSLRIWDMLTCLWNHWFGLGVNLRFKMTSTQRMLHPWFKHLHRIATKSSCSPHDPTYSDCFPAILMGWNFLATSAFGSEFWAACRHCWPFPRCS